MQKKRLFPGIPRRGDGRVAWSATKAERAAIAAHLNFRRTHDVDERGGMEVPPQANYSFGGALQLALGSMWQDRPWFLVGGAACLLGTFILHTHAWLS